MIMIESVNKEVAKTKPEIIAIEIKGVRIEPETDFQLKREFTRPEEIVLQFIVSNVFNFDSKTQSPGYLESTLHSLFQDPRAKELRGPENRYINNFVDRVKKIKAAQPKQ